MIIRPYAALSSDALATLEVFTRAVREGARRDYTLEQVLAWAPDAPEVVAWDARRSAVATAVAVIESQIAGFTDVAADGYIDMMFVHPLFTRRGVASALLASLGDGPLWTNASITARGFFEQNGFVVDAEQVVNVRGQELVNYRMSRGALGVLGSLAEWAGLGRWLGSRADVAGSAGSGLSARRPFFPHPLFPHPLFLLSSRIPSSPGVCIDDLCTDRRSSIHIHVRVRDNFYMPSFEVMYVSQMAAVRDAAAELMHDSTRVLTLTDAELLREQRGLAEIRRLVDGYASAVAGEVAYRSRRELGHSGLAQREGFRSAEALVQATTGSSARDAATLVHVGGLLNGESPWLAPVAAAVSAGELSAPAAQAISAALGAPVSTDARHVDADDLTAAAASLLERSSTLTVDELGRRARELRDELDAAGVAEREKALHEERALRRTRRPNGLFRYTIDPDIEAAAFLDDVYDKLMSPRRNGPRFIDATEKAWAEEISADPRSTEQYLHDAFTELIRQAVGADTVQSRRVIGSRSPSVRVLVAATALDSATGIGYIEGQSLPVSLGTVERIACAEGTVTIGFDERGRVLNLGREQRLFSPAQRLVLAARDGGCMVPDCSAPPAWTEAHHIHPWKRDGGKTDVADGILLCRFHHMLLHNNGWEIERHGPEYRLIPPRDVDPSRTPRALRSKSRALRDLLTG